MDENEKLSQELKDTREELNDKRQELIELLKMRDALLNEAAIHSDEEPSQQAGPSSGNRLTLGNGHSILGEEHPVIDTSKISSGFINKLFMALLVGFASGAIITAAYIFLNLGKVVVSI